MPDSNGSRQETLLCQKTQTRVPGGAPVCADPDRPCKFRSDCVIYALWVERRLESK